MPAAFAEACPPEVIAWAQATLGLEARAVRYWHEEFVDAARAGSVGPFTDWMGAFRNSLRRNWSRPIPPAYQATVRPQVVTDIAQRLFGQRRGVRA